MLSLAVRASNISPRLSTLSVVTSRMRLLEGRAVQISLNSKSGIRFTRRTTSVQNIWATSCIPKFIFVRMLPLK